MLLINKHKHDYMELNKKELRAIIKEYLTYRKSLSEKEIYIANNSKRNNAKRAIKHLWKNRQNIVTNARIKKHINTLRLIPSYVSRCV